MSYYRCGGCGLGMGSAVALAAGDRCPRCATELVCGEGPAGVSIARHSRFGRGVAGPQEVVSEGSLGRFAITSHVVDQVAWIELRGELDIATAPELERALAAVPLEGSAVLDLHALDFIDAAGMRAVLSAYRRLRERLRIIPAPERLQRVFRIAGLEQALPFEPAGAPARIAARARIRTGRPRALLSGEATLGLDHPPFAASRRRFRLPVPEDAAAPAPMTSERPISRPSGR